MHMTLILLYYMFSLQNSQQEYITKQTHQASLELDNRDSLHMSKVSDINCFTNSQAIFKGEVKSRKLFVNEIKVEMISENPIKTENGRCGFLLKAFAEC